MNYKIREIQERDYLEVAKLYKNLRKIGEEYMFSFYSNYRKNTKMKADIEIANNIIKKKTLKKDTKFLILEINWKINWFIYWSIFYPEDEVYIKNDYVWWELNHIFINEEYRWKWFSIKLRDELFKWFKGKNVEIIEISVNQDNPSYEIYKKWWFESKFCYVSKEF